MRRELGGRRHPGSRRQRARAAASRRSFPGMRAREEPAPPLLTAPTDSRLLTWTQAAVGGVPAPAVPAPALGSWKIFLSLQKIGRLGVGGLQGAPEVTAAPVPLPLDPQEVTQEVCKAVPFTQVLSRPGCSTARVHNRICFGRCASLYVPGSDPASLALCNGCEPARQRRAPVVLWCRGGRGRAFPRRVKTSTVLIDSCRCSPKA
ncbi:DAN domain family member 5 [Lepus europaeus]|uniref:DAN domain family member 5 n=1 Tax=Lepus europaeus TaxID=9983 RepID=UPI002B48D5AD|nr:DAN domain family member 5 [Lepus europaeus]